MVGQLPDLAPPDDGGGRLSSGSRADSASPVRPAQDRQPPPPAPVAPVITEAEQLETLAALHDKGKLTDEEFAAAKSRVLA